MSTQKQVATKYPGFRKQTPPYEAPSPRNGAPCTLLGLSVFEALTDTTCALMGLIPKQDALQNSIFVRWGPNAGKAQKVRLHIGNDDDYPAGDAEAQH